MTEVISIESQNDLSEPDFDFVPDNISKTAVPARVKWFDQKAGYGFVNIYGYDDIFIGQAVLRKSLLGEVKIGLAINIQTADNQGRKIVYRAHDWLEGEAVASLQLA